MRCVLVIRHVGVMLAHFNPSILSATLQEYVQCLRKRFPWDQKTIELFWRGGNTGCGRGWPANVPYHEGVEGTGNTSFYKLLSCKRVMAALMSHPHKDLNVKMNFMFEGAAGLKGGDLDVGIR
jgi:hypothetical protein